MATKKSKYDRQRAIRTFQAILNGVNVTPSELSYLRRVYRGDDEFNRAIVGNYGNNAKVMSIFGGGNITLSRGSVRDAKDMYDTAGFFPMQNEKKAGPGTNAMIARSGLRTNQTGSFQDANILPDGRAQVVGGRTRTRGETESVIRRGMAGAKLGFEDQRIFDAWRTQNRLKEEAMAQEAANAEAKRAMDEQYKRERAEKFSVLGIPDSGQTDAQIDDLIARRDAEFKTNEEIRRTQEIEAIKAKQKAYEEAAIEAKWRADNNIDPYDVVSDFERAQIKSGDKAWGYRPEDKRAIDALEARLAEIYRGTDASEEDRANLSNQLEAYKGRVRKGLIDNPNGLTAEQAFGKTYLDENGVRWGVKDGMAVKLSEPKQDAEDKGLERQQKIADDENNYRRKWFDDHITELMKPKKGMVKDDLSETGFSEGLIPGLSYEEAYNQAVKDSEMRFAETVQENGHDICPECGAPLDANGVCTNRDCGYGRAEEESPSKPTGHVKNRYL